MPDLDDELYDDLADDDGEEDDPQDDTGWEHEPGCCCPDRCIVAGDHRQGDCWTAEDAEAYDQAMKEAEHAPPPSRNRW